MIRLTLIGNPEVDGGGPTTCFVEASAISSIRRTVGGYAKSQSYGKTPLEFHELVACTELHCCHYTLFVTESPEDVALLRDKAMGISPPKPKAVT